MAAGSTSTGDQLSSYMVTHVLADGSPLGGPRLSCANGIWVGQSFPLEPSFQEIVKNAYKAAVTSVDFQYKANEVREEVNKWAEKETKGLIQEILPPGSVDALTTLILANAMYFKGVWNEKFDSSLTKDDKFSLLNRDSVQAPFMTSWEQQYVRVFDNFKVFSLPYKQGRDHTRHFSMYIFLPNAKYGLPALLEKFSSESGFIEHHLPYSQVSVGDFRIPKFKIVFGFEASKVLNQQGLLPPLVDSKGGQNLYISSIFHKSFIEVNEEGTQAAALSAGVFSGCSMWHEVKLVDFVADHPFLFVIREDTTGAVLFVGQILNPLAG